MFVTIEHRDLYQLQKLASVIVISMTLVQLILLERLLVVAMRHTFTLIGLLVFMVLRTRVFITDCLASIALCTSFQQFATLQWLRFSRFISDLDIEHSQFLQSFLCIFQGCPRLLNHTYDD